MSACCASSRGNRKMSKPSSRRLPPTPQLEQSSWKNLPGTILRSLWTTSGLPGGKPDVVQSDRRIVPGKFFQELCSSCGVGGNLLDEGFDIFLFPLDEAQQADILLVVQQLVEQTIAIVPRRLRSTARGQSSGLRRLTTAHNASD